MIRPEDHDSLVEAIYATVVDATCWQAALTGLRAAFDASAVSLQTYDGTTQGSYSTAPDISAEYVRNWAWRNPVQIGSLRSGSVAVDHQVVDRDLLASSAYYNEFLLPSDISRMMFVQGMPRSPFSANINILRGRRQPDFAAAELMLAGGLAPHIKNAVHTAALLNARSQADFAASLETAREAIILVGQAGAVLHMNRAARELTEARDGIVARGPGLDAVIARDGKRLRDAIWCAATAPAPRVGTMLTIERPSHARPLIASVTPLAEQLIEIGVARPRALIAILDPTRAAASPAAGLRHLFGLTRREAEIAGALAEGLTIAEAATRCGVTLATARNYLARVLRKTQVNRQGDLVSLLNGLARLADASRTA